MSLMLARRAVVRSPLRFSLAATDYLKRLDAVGARIRAYDRANANLIDALVELGGAYWDTAGTITTLCAKGFDGLTVPLRDGMNVGTPHEFEESDLDVKTGLQRGSGKQITTELKGDDLPQNDVSLGAWITEAIGSGFTFMGAGTSESGATSIRNTSVLWVLRNRNSISNLVDREDRDLGFIGFSRGDSSKFKFRGGGTTDTLARDSQTPTSNPFILVDSGVGRVSVAWVKTAIDLETMDGILTQFMAEVDAV